MSDKPDPGYVRFWIENGTEVAMCTAQDFRAAMNERDELRVEVERRTRIMDDLAWAHAPCDCESHQRWLTFDRPKEC